MSLCSCSQGVTCWKPNGGGGGAQQPKALQVIASYSEMLKIINMNVRHRNFWRVWLLHTGKNFETRIFAIHVKVTKAKNVCCWKKWLNENQISFSSELFRNRKRSPTFFRNIRFLMRFFHKRLKSDWKPNQFFDSYEIWLLGIIL